MIALVCAVGAGCHYLRSSRHGGEVRSNFLSRRSEMWQKRILLLLVMSVLIWPVRAQEPTQIPALAVVWQNVASRPVDQVAEADEWGLMIHYKLCPAGDRDYVLQTEVITSTCRPMLDMTGEGDCGLSTPLVVNAEEWGNGSFETWARAMWTNGEETIFCSIVNPLEPAEDEWHLVSRFEIDHRLHFPLQIEIR